MCCSEIYFVITNHRWIRKDTLKEAEKFKNQLALLGIDSNIVVSKQII